MATLTLSVTIPDDQVTRLRDAARLHYNSPTMTTAQATAAIRQDVIAMVKTMVRRVEKAAAIAAAELVLRNAIGGSTVTDVDAT
jgi:hypothetical protein